MPFTDEEMARVFEARALPVGNVNIPGRQLGVRATTIKSVHPRTVTLSVEVAKQQR